MTKNTELRKLNTEHWTENTEHLTEKIVEKFAVLRNLVKQQRWQNEARNLGFNQCFGNSYDEEEDFKSPVIPTGFN